MSLPDRTLCWVEGPPWDRHCEPVGPQPLAEPDLHLAVHGPYAPPSDDDHATLIWRAGQHRREIEDAHAYLDLQGVPREVDGGTLTLRGRLERL